MQSNRLHFVCIFGIHLQDMKYELLKLKTLHKDFY
jgi:hypothetical protein